MTATDFRREYRSRWKALPMAERRELVRGVYRGNRGASREEAALMLWWAREQLRAGLWTALGGLVGAMLGVVLTITALSLLQGEELTSVWEQGRGAAAGAFLPWAVLAVLLWWVRRPKVKRAAQLNAAVLAGHEFSGPPDPEEAERLLNLVRKEGWLRGTRPER